MICKCYHAERNFVGKIGVCWGTKEREACSCGGDKSKCDFYPSVRKEGKKPQTNYDWLIKKTPEELAEFMHDMTLISTEIGLSKEWWEQWLKSPVKEGDK